ncbi:MAG TPA: hypothetical protein DCZ72_15995, partial [Armatimonadetes bacterium]|nr:hypothetical protein [Armatimonadota bacterium]
CLSNLKQISLALIQYSGDYDEKYVINECAVNDASGRRIRWFESLQPYMKSYQIGICPSMFNNVGGNQFDVNLHYSLNNFYYYDRTLGAIFERGGSGPSPISAVEDPAGTVFCADALHWPGEFQFVGFDNGFYRWNGFLLFASGQGDLMARHLDGYNVAFLDGHAKWLRAEELHKQNAAGRYPYLTIISDGP